MYYALCRVLVGVLVLSSSAIAQERYESGPQKGYLKENPELGTVEQGPFRVSSVHGIVKLGDTGVAGVFFEIRDSAGRVRSALTDSNGAFKIPHVPTGHYAFRTMKDGFESTVGVITVEKRIPRSRLIEVDVHLGT